LLITTATAAKSSTRGDNIFMAQQTCLVHFSAHTEKQTKNDSINYAKMLRQIKKKNKKKR